MRWHCSAGDAKPMVGSGSFLEQLLKDRKRVAAKADETVQTCVGIALQVMPSPWSGVAHSLSGS